MKHLIPRILAEAGVNEHIAYTSNENLRKELNNIMVFNIIRGPEYSQINKDYNFNMAKLKFKSGDITFKKFWGDYPIELGILDKNEPVTIDFVEKIERKMEELNINEGNIISEDIEEIETNLNEVYSNFVRQFKADIEKSKTSKEINNIENNKINIGENGSFIYTGELDPLWRNKGIGTIIIQEEDSKLNVNKNYTHSRGVEKDIITSEVIKYDENDIEMEMSKDGYRYIDSNERIKFSLKSKRDLDYPFIISQSYDYEKRLYNERTKKYDIFEEIGNDEKIVGYTGKESEYEQRLNIPSSYRIYNLYVPEVNKKSSIDFYFPYDGDKKPVEISSKDDFGDFYNSNKESILQMINSSHNTKYTNFYEKILNSSLKEDLENVNKEKNTEVKSTLELGKETMEEQKEIKAKESILSKIFRKKLDKEKGNR